MKTLISKISFVLPIIIIMLLNNACRSSVSEIYKELTPLSDEFEHILNPETTGFELKSINEGFIGWNNCFWEYSENVYYITNKGIMRWHKHSGSVLIVSERDIGGIVIDEPWLYYYTTNGMEVYKADLNGDYRQCIFKTNRITDPKYEKQITGFTVYQGILYIKDSPISCFAYDMITGEQKRFNEDMSSGVFLNNKFYYIEYAQRTFSIYASDLGTRNTELIRGDGITYEFEHPKEGKMYDKLAIVDGNLFYSTRVIPSVFLYKENHQDLLIEDFSSLELDSMFVTMVTDNRYLYYTLEGTNILHRYDPTTNEVTPVKTPDDFEASKGFIIVKDILYYTLKNGRYKAVVIAL